MSKQIFKFAFAVIVTAIAGLALNTLLGYIGNQWTLASMAQVSNNMGDQVAIRASMNTWGIAYWGTLIVGIGLILAFWGFLYKDSLGKIFPLMVIMGILLSACSTSNFVIITPPNYAIVIDLSSPTNQAVGNNFGEGELMNVTQIQVNMVKCALNSNDYCPDKLVAEVPGAPESRIYSKDSNTGTSAGNQALCFEATGANGCVDFSVTAIILKDDAKCYANKMGVKPVLEGDNLPSRFHFMATPLAQALDTRVIQIASAKFAEQVAPISPLTLAIQKFQLFDQIKPDIMKAVHDQTCITLTDLSINNGITWADQSIQDQIDQQTILVNQLALVGKQNDILEAQNQAFIQRAYEIEQKFGLQAAIEFMRIQKWNGSYVAYPLQELSASQMTPGAYPTAVQPATVATPTP